MYELPNQKKKKVTGNSPGCFSITDQESTQRASFPILEPKKHSLESLSILSTVTQQMSA